MGFEDGEYPASGGIRFEARLKPFHLLAVILGCQHASDDGHLGLGRDEFCHEFGRQAAVQLRIYAHYR